MSLKIATPLDMLFNRILNFVLENLATDPTGNSAGQMYWNTTSDTVRVYNGTTWGELGADMAAADILSALLTVDGDGSSLDADTVDGLEAAAFALAAHTHTASQITDFNAVVDARIVAAFTNNAVDATVDTIAEFTQLIKDNEGDIANILSIKRHDELLGSSTSVTVTHNLNTTVPIVQVVEEATGETVLADVTRNGANSVVIGFGTAPAANAYRAIILA